MSSGFGVFVAFGQTKINDIDYMLVFPCSDKEVIWLNVSMQKTILVNKFYPLKLQDYEYYNITI